jgi:nitrite transporter NirC
MSTLLQSKFDKCVEESIFMISAGYELLEDAAKKKVRFFKEAKIAYFVSSVLAGVFVGFSMITILVMAGMLGDFAGIKIIQGASFAAALSFVLFAGAELFTGNVFVMTGGIMRGSVKIRDGIALCAYCYLGNLVGSIIIAALFLGTGYLQGSVLVETTKAISAKIYPSAIELFVRGIMCNILVCLAVWCTFRLKSESAKLIMIFWCIYVFVVCGFEHSIANMTLFSLGTMARCSPFDLMSLNLVMTSVGNLVGGVLLALAYWSIARKSVA